MRSFLFIFPLALAACQPAGPEVDVDDATRALADACLAEVGLPVLPDRVTESAQIELTPEQQEAFAACVQRRGAG